MKTFKTITGEELLNKELAEIPFVVKDLIPCFCQSKKEQLSAFYLPVYFQ